MKQRDFEMRCEQCGSFLEWQFSSASTIRVRPCEYCITGVGTHYADGKKAAVEYLRAQANGMQLVVKASIESGHGTEIVLYTQNLIRALASAVDAACVGPSPGSRDREE